MFKPLTLLAQHALSYPNVRAGPRPRRCIWLTPYMRCLFPSTVATSIDMAWRANTGEPLKPPIDLPSTRYTSVSLPLTGNLSDGIIAMFPVLTIGMCLVEPKNLVNYLMTLISSPTPRLYSFILLSVAKMLTGMYSTSKRSVGSKDGDGYVHGVRLCRVIPPLQVAAKPPGLSVFEIHSYYVPLSVDTFSHMLSCPRHAT